MILQEITIQGSVRLNRLKNTYQTTGAGGWSVKREDAIIDPPTFKIELAEELLPGYSLNIYGISEGRRGILNAIAVDVTGKSFTAILLSQEGNLPETVGFSFTISGTTAAETPDDRHIGKEQRIEDLHALEIVLNHEAEFGFITLMASASIESRERTAKDIKDQTDKVQQAEQELQAAAEADKPSKAISLKRAQIKLERFHKLLKAVPYWDSALEFGRLWGKYSTTEQKHRFGGRRYVPLCTGGGPGIMRAAAVGARETGAQVIGIDAVFANDEYFSLNLDSNPRATEQPPPVEFSFANSHFSLASNVRLRCNDFAIREAALINYAYVILFWPGGYGTVWEVFETLSKIQTTHLRRWRTKAVFVHREYWEPLFAAIAHMRDVGTINAYGDRIYIPGIDDLPNDAADGAYIAEVVDSAQEAFNVTKAYVESLGDANRLSLH